ncbi:MAG: DUF21 domain-containing protein [Lentisphaerae bacterium]|nr:DUF21 domain-containing protein [Lentisphaerota bacterium]
MVRLHIFLIFACMACEALFSGMETGMISIQRMRLRHFVKRGSRSASLIEDYLNDPDRLLGLTLAGTNLCMVTVSVISANLSSHLLGAWARAAAAIATPLAILVFSEYLPKTWFHSRPIQRCSRFVGILRSFEVVLKPISISIVWLTRWLVPMKKSDGSRPAPLVTRDDLKLLAGQGEKDGVLSPRERFMIHRVIELPVKRARDIMVPREDISFVTRDTPLRAFFEKARSTDLHRMPVLDPASGAFVGVVNVFYALPVSPETLDQPVSKYMRKPAFLPDTMPVDDILPHMRRSGAPLCLVREQSGEVIGLLTTENVLGEIVGKLN